MPPTVITRSSCHRVSVTSPRSAKGSGRVSCQEPSRRSGPGPAGTPAGAGSKPSRSPASASASSGATAQLGQPPHRRHLGERGQGGVLVGTAPSRPLPRRRPAAGPGPAPRRPGARAGRASSRPTAAGRRRRSPAARPGRPRCPRMRRAGRGPAVPPAPGSRPARSRSGRGGRLRRRRRRSDGAERSHPGRQQLVEPPAQRRGQRDQRGGGLDRPGVEHDEVGVGARRARRTAPGPRPGQRDHGARRREGQLREQRTEAFRDPAPEPLQRSLWIHADDVQPGDVAEPGHGLLPGEQDGAVAGPGRPDGGRRGERRRPGPARAGEQQRAHGELSPRRAS